MPIPVDYFQPLSFQQANPFLAGLQTGQDIYKTGMQNAYLPQSLQQQLQSDQLKNSLMQNQANFAPQMSQAQLDLTQAQAQRQQAMSKLPGGGQVYPGAAGQVQGLEFVRQLYGENSPQYQEAQRILNQTLALQNARAQYFSANVGLKNVPTQEKHSIIGQGMPLGVSNAPQPVTPQNPSIPITAAAPAQPVQPQTQNSLSTSSGQNNLNTPLTQRTAQIATNQALTTNTQKNRLQAGAALEDFLGKPSSQNALNTLANYSGWEGRTKAQVQRFTNPNAYLQYQNANEQLPTIIAGGLKVLEGYPSTDQSVQRVTNYFNAAKNIMNSDAPAAAAYIRQGLQFIKDENVAMQTINQPVFKMGNIYGEQNNASAKKSDPLGIR